MGRKKLRVFGFTRYSCHSDYQHRRDKIVSRVKKTKMEEVYSEILYEVLNTAGCDAMTKEGRDALLFYLQEVFKIDDDKHILLLEKSRERKGPSIFLNVEIIEAMNLKSTDPNGLSDPFCTIYLASANPEHHTTSVKQETLHPVWEECFTLPVKNPDKDVLCIEVWDFDPEETTREKMKKIKEVKGMRGLKIFMKEIASSSRHNNDLVGTALLPLKKIPAIGQTIWCTLEKNGKMKKQGDVKIRLSFNFEKNSKAALQEHRHLLSVMLLHELRISKAESLNWSGKFSTIAETILTQHLVQCGLPALNATLTRWIEFINVHILHPLNFNIFLHLLQTLAKPLQDNLMTDEEETSFWEAAKKLLASCMVNIRKLQIESLNNTAFDQSSAILSILSLMATLQSPKDTDLFPFTMYDWLILKDGDTNCDIHTIVVQAIHQGSKDWFAHVLEDNKVDESADEEEKLNKLVTILDLATACLRKAVTIHDKLFQEHFHFPYARELYRQYEIVISELVEPIVMSASKSMKHVKFIDGMEEGSCDSVTLTIGASLFQVYISLQQFSGFGKSLYTEDTDTFLLQSFYLWFYPAALQWLYISSYKSLHGIKKAIHLDQFAIIDDNIEHSSSAIDTLQIFEQIRIFWKRLAWPDNEAAFTFATNIINDICNCSSFYADQISEKVERMCESGHVHEKEFKVTRQWCVAVKNIVHIQQSIKKIIAEFELEEIINSLVSSGNYIPAETCRQTVHTIIDSGTNDVSKKLCEMMERAARKMMPTISRLLIELNSDISSIDELMKYLDDTLCVLNTYLSTDHFKLILDMIWKNISQILYHFMENNTKINREPSFYKKQHEILTIVVDFFKQSNEDIATSDLTKLKKIDHMLLLNGMETWELIHQYYLERREEQKAMETPIYGLLTVRMQFAENILRIEILNARNLQPLSNKSTCNPYVKISLLPEETFSGITTFVTKTHKKVMFPLFEETFAVELTPQQKNIGNGLVMFTVKDNILFGVDKFLAEGFFTFSDITKTDFTVGLENMEQMHLKLNRSTKFESDAANVLLKREDKQARDFIKKRKHMFPVNDTHVYESMRD